MTAPQRQQVVSVACNYTLTDCDTDAAHVHSQWTGSCMQQQWLAVLVVQL